MALDLEKILLGGDQGRRDTPLTALPKIARNFAEIAAALAGTIYLGLLGAVGDGVANDTAAIQAALNSSGGKRVVGEAGKIYSCLNILVPRGAIFDGSGITLKARVATADGFVIGFAADATDARIINTTIDGNKAAQTFKVDGVKLRGSRVLVADNHINEATGSGVSVDAGASWFGIVRNTLRGHDLRGVTIEFSSTLETSYFSVSDNTISDVGSTGISWISGDDGSGLSSAGIHYAQFIGNRVFNTGLDVVAGGIGGYSKNNRFVLIANNVLEGIGNHVFHVGGNNITITGNIARDITRSGVLVRNWPNEQTTGGDLGNQVIIANNTFELTADPESGSGISVQNYERVTIANNIIRGSAKTGIEVLGKRLSRTSRCTDVTISGNQVFEVIDLTVAPSIIESGIDVNQVDRVTINGNVVRGTNDSGIRTENCLDLIIQGNISSDSTGGAGILVLNGADSTENVLIQGNACEDNGTFGIQLSSAVNRVVVADNIIRGNTSGQLNLGSATNVSLRGNIGYRTRNRGTSSVADGGTIAHGLAAAPTSYTLTATAANRTVAVTAANATNLTIALKDNTGAAVTTPENVNWEAAAESHSA